MKHLISVPQNLVPHFHTISKLSKKDWYVSSDPDNQKVGSGGGTAQILSELFKEEQQSDFNSWLEKEKRVIIHAGGQSRRLPAYAPIGKSLIPLPVFRWSRGQHLNQRLVHLQSPLFDKIIEKAPKNLNTLIASGDTLIFEGNQIPEIPEADVVCFGLWLAPEKATNHGVFFAKHESPGQLEFMLQKPPISKIQELIHQYHFIMDIGVWLLSPKAINILMKKCGWNKGRFEKGIPEYYDLYSTFGTALGHAPSASNPEINELKVALVNLEGGEFHHFGNTSELVSSTLKIQNRVHDQRKIWHKHVKPHQSVFVLNAEIKNRFTSVNRNIWVENSRVPDSWNLSEQHVITGIPENSWNINLHPGNCLDFISINTDELVIRNYGFNDSFSGEWDSASTLFMEEPLSDWLAKRELNTAFVSGSDLKDIFDLPLFPILNRKNIDEDFINWLLQPSPDRNKTFSDLWVNSKRVNCNEISKLCNISITEEYRKSNLLKNYSLLAKNHQNSVFYQLDLKKVAADYVENQLPLPDEIEHMDDKLLSIHDKMFRSHYLRLKTEEWETQEHGAFEYLKNKIVETYQTNPVEPKINLHPDQIAWGRSPVRIDLAGGWTDTPPYCFLYGGKVVNVAVELNGQPPLHCYIKATTSNEIVLRSIDLGAQEVIKSFEQIRSFENIQSPFSIPKTALALSGFLPEFSKTKFNALENQLTAMGGGLELTILSAVPKGSGLGTSSILAATVLGTLSEVCGLNWDKPEIGKRTLALEQLLTTGGGWQDQFGGLFEGVKLLETEAGKLQEPSVKWLPDTLFTSLENKNRILLYYTGITRVAKNILGEIVRGMFLNSKEHLAVLDELKHHALNTYDILLKKDFQDLTHMVDKSWQLNQKIDAGTNTPEIQKLIDKIQHYLSGHKLLGAGGGGFMLMLAKDEQAAARIKLLLANNPVNPRARFVDFEISKTGFQVTKS